MIQLLLVVLYFAHLVLATSINTTGSNCPPPDATTRSVWKILGSCGLTLLICVWHSMHFNVPPLRGEQSVVQVPNSLLLLSSFAAPELIVGIAIGEWWEARRRVILFRGMSFQQ